MGAFAVYARPPPRLVLLRLALLALLRFALLVLLRLALLALLRLALLAPRLLQRLLLLLIVSPLS